MVLPCHCHPPNLNNPPTRTTPCTTGDLTIAALSSPSTEPNLEDKHFNHDLLFRKRFTYSLGLNDTMD
ncbi:hypothetical protein HYQ44_012723 [Verticillium longisporum]|nr:hypothetical protein HYQ44_012723 [Verticillium longisporum]